MTEPVMHPDQLTEQLRRTEDYIRARYGDRPIPAYDEGGEPVRDQCSTCGHSTAPIWFGQPGSGDHSEDDGSCITCGPELGKRCAWDEADR